MVAEALLRLGPNAEAEYHLREAHTNISTAAAETNKPELCLEHSLKYLESALEKRSPMGTLVIDFELGLTYNEAGVAQSMNGQFREAMESFRKCAEIWQSLDNYDETMMGLPYGNIGLVHWIEGRYTEALETLHEMRKIYARNYGVDDVKTFKYVISGVQISKGSSCISFV
jgi:tetratricopeptide (TPR) repeat protein